MSQSSEPFLAWPGLGHLRRFLWISLLFGVWWVLIYGGASWITAQRTTRFRVHFDSELAMPFWPPMVLVYQSVFPALWLSPFVLRRPAELDRFALALGGITFVGGICFLLVPADLAYKTRPPAGAWEPLLHFSKIAALEYNLVPSLHVGLAVTSLGIYASRVFVSGRALAPGSATPTVVPPAIPLISKLALKIALWSWAAAIAAATLLIHHHHVVDVIFGWLLGWSGYRWFVSRTAADAHGNRSPSPDTSA